MDEMQKKTPEALSMEKKAEEMERTIVRFTNIDNESFTHSFRGISITVKKGESFVGRLPECDHLATHLARKIIARDKKSKIDPMKAYTLFPESEVIELKAKILSEVAHEQPEISTPEEARKKDVEQLAKTYQPPIVTKKDVIKDLESRGLKVDASKSKEELLEQLMNAEQQGLCKN